MARRDGRPITAVIHTEVGTVSQGFHDDSAADAFVATMLGLLPAGATAEVIHHDQAGTP